MTPDPHLENVVALLHFDGTFTDEAGGVVTPAGSASINADQSKFGRASCLFGAGGRISIANSVGFAFGSGAFTVEAWVYRIATPSIAYGLITKRASNANYSPFNLELNSSSRVVAQVSVSGTSWVTIVGSTQVPVNVFTHIALVRSGNALWLFVNGLLDGTATVSGALFENGSGLVLGATDATGAYSLIGRLDEVRITKGVARYTAPFTPSAEAFAAGNLSGNATTTAGDAVDHVAAFVWPNGGERFVATPVANGDWQIGVPYVGAAYGISYVADGCAPVTHGPYSLAS